MSTATTDKPVVNNAPAKSEPSNPVIVIGQQVRNYLEKGTLRLPADYSPENALKSAWLTLQETQDSQKRPVLQACTRESVMNALLDMVVQGLNPSKKQCYFIAYGAKLICQRSYFGDIALAERVRPGVALYYDVIYEGEAFATSKIRTRSGLVTTVAKHEQPFPRASNKLVGAYCGLVDTETGEDLGVTLMDMDQIRKSWNQGQTKGQSGAHQNFPDQMALRTVIRRACKPLINSSSDALLLESVRRQDEEAIEAEVEEDARVHANGETLALSAPVATAVETPEPDEERLGKPPVEETDEPGF